MKAVGDRELAADCAAHARMFFNSSFSLSPTDAMAEELRRDNSRMAGMIIVGDAARFEESWRLLLLWKRD